MNNYLPKGSLFAEYENCKLVSREGTGGKSAYINLSDIDPNSVLVFEEGIQLIVKDYEQTIVIKDRATATISPEKYAKMLDDAKFFPSLFECNEESCTTSSKTDNILIPLEENASIRAVDLAVKSRVEECQEQ